MIDWVSATYPQRKEYGKVKIYETSKLLSLSPSGDVRWQRSDAEQVSGSHDSKLYAKSPDQCDLYISGNPVKFFQGHNLFGSSDYVGLWLSAGLAVRQECGLFPSPQTAAATFDQPHFTRLDLTRSYLFPSDAIARSWLREVASVAHSRHGAPTTQAGTVYWGQGSKRWTMKAYLKSDEIKSRKRSHWISSALGKSVVDELTDWAAGVVRFELQLRTLELDSILQGRTRPLTEDELLAIWQTYFDRIAWNRNIAVLEGSDMLDTTIEDTLPVHLQGKLALWRQGRDLRELMPHNTFYRTRRALMAAVGVDIAAPAPAKELQEAIDPNLDPAGWDPKPLESHVYVPDGQIAIDYGLA